MICLVLGVDWARWVWLGISNVIAVRQQLELGFSQTSSSHGPRRLKWWIVGIAGLIGHLSVYMVFQLVFQNDRPPGSEISYVASKAFKNKNFQRTEGKRHGLLWPSPYILTDVILSSGGKSWSMGKWEKVLIFLCKKKPRHTCSIRNIYI